MGGWWSIKGGLSVGEGRGLRTGEEESGSVTRGGGRRTWGGNGGRGLGSEEPGKQGGLGQRGEAALLDTSPNGPTPPHLILLSSTSHSVLGPNSPHPPHWPCSPSRPPAGPHAPRHIPSLPRAAVPRSATRPLTAPARCAAPGPPSAPRDLQYSLSRSPLALRLRWLPPADSGGRSDVTYSLLCLRCGREGPAGACEPCGPRVAFVPRQAGLRERAATLLHLRPGARYTVRVAALNGVSGPAAAAGATYAQVTVSTGPGGKATPRARTSPCRREAPASSTPPHPPRAAPLHPSRASLYPAATPHKPQSLPTPQQTGVSSGDEKSTKIPNPGDSHRVSAPFPKAKREGVRIQVTPCRWTRKDGSV